MKWKKNSRSSLPTKSILSLWSFVIVIHVLALCIQMAINNNGMPEKYSHCFLPTKLILSLWSFVMKILLNTFEPKYWLLIIIYG